MAEICSVFVYGTLKRGQLREHCWPVDPQRVTIGFSRGDLFDLGPYPAMTAGGGIVVGELWQFESSVMVDVLTVLDGIEGYVGPGADNLYDRVIIRVHAGERLQDSQPVDAFAYWMTATQVPRTASRLPSPSRWPADGASPEVTSQLPDPFS